MNENEVIFKNFRIVRRIMAAICNFHNVKNIWVSYFIFVLLKECAANDPKLKIAVNVNSSFPTSSLAPASAMLQSSSSSSSSSSSTTPSSFDSIEENESSFEGFSSENYENYSRTLSDARKITAFYLYTRRNAVTPQRIYIEDPFSLTGTFFNKLWPTRILIHGWNNNGITSPFNLFIKNAYLRRGNFNVITCDWGAIAQDLNYLAVVTSVPSIGQIIGDFILFLHFFGGVSFNDIYLIGHSLGAHVAGFAGKNIFPHRINTIFGLDPAKPGFENGERDYRLDYTDANYVEIIHTSVTDVGLLEPVGHADFYVNYGEHQPGCITVVCNHIKAYKYFAESIVSMVGFYGRKCNSIVEYKLKLCHSPLFGNFRRMGGEPSNNSNRGIFFLPVNRRKPYAKGILGL